MTAEQPLSGLRVLVTRPRHQSQQLVTLLTKAGAVPIMFPVIEIVAIEHPDWQPQTMAQVDWLMFVSPNAVRQFCKIWQAPLPDSVKLVAVGGRSTAQAMQQAGLPVDLLAPAASGSDGLITLPELQTLHGQQVVIVRGEGGRDLLADTLAERGATINYMEVYRRVLPDYTSNQLQQALAADRILVTSLAGVQNLMQLLAENWAELKQKPLVVFSERIRQYAKKAGFALVSVTTDFSDEALVTSLIEMDKQHGKQ